MLLQDTFTMPYANSGRWYGGKVRSDVDGYFTVNIAVERDIERYHIAIFSIAFEPALKLITRSYSAENKLFTFSGRILYGDLGFQLGGRYYVDYLIFISSTPLISLDDYTQEYTSPMRSVNNLLTPGVVK